ncbi:MAG: hypothetical protein EXR98_12970 [Gemmataceae bacterium]|nr:hypothetical protein [Gemmataceae bacterium]
MFDLKNTAAKTSRRGTVAVLVAVSITLLLGMVALTLDGGLLQDNKRRVQNAADGAAIAAANTIFKNYPTIASTGTADPGGQAAAAALNSASENGFADNAVGGGLPPNLAETSVVVHIPPLSGPFTGTIGYAEVIITFKQPRYFSTIWGSTATPVEARAVAKGFWGGTGKGVIVLDPVAKQALSSTGGAAGIVTGGAAVVVDSNNIDAASASGGGTFTADNFLITGGYTGVFNGVMTTGVLPTPDPLAYLPVPPVPENGTITKKNLGKGNHQYVLTPGRHTAMPRVNVGDVVIFKQASHNANGGIYYIDGGGWSSTGATIKMDSTTSGGVMLYNHPNSSAQSESIGITGNSAGSVNLSALTSGPYAGLLMWQDRTATQSMSIAGQGSFDLTGIFYTANANLAVSGNGVAIIGSQYISRTLTLSGNGAVNINYTDQGTARKREVRLVE